ncbi:hypothetical protein MTO96_016698 [Rhipicephalus appendiculatus]
MKSSRGRTKLVRPHRALPRQNSAALTQRRSLSSGNRSREVARFNRDATRSATAAPRILDRRGRGNLNTETGRRMGEIGGQGRPKYSSRDSGKIFRASFSFTIFSPLPLVLRRPLEAAYFI